LLPRLAAPSVERVTPHVRLRISGQAATTCRGSFTLDTSPPRTKRLRLRHMAGLHDDRAITIEWLFIWDTDSAVPLALVRNQTR